MSLRPFRDAAEVSHLHLPRRDGGGGARGALGRAERGSGLGTAVAAFDSEKKDRADFPSHPLEPRCARLSAKSARVVSGSEYTTHDVLRIYTVEGTKCAWRVAPNADVRQPTNVTFEGGGDLQL